ncbi:hypothetical protein SAMN04487989_10555 [Bizionia echini]|uniref:Uncharacterized protein n=1 Tax=Bizionia echini TaxID=649333 RepID=A0A1I5CG62_9FLAO|nr:hypothetical protein [Bizionia echini]SFN85913.1 hypothetical protein SAMN04487989_10555 [Bizionia echini]
MRQFLLIGIFTVFSLAGMQAQTSNKTEDLKKIESTSQKTVAVKTESNELAAKKKDILTEKIESKLNGRINIFVLKETRLIC